MDDKKSAKKSMPENKMEISGRLESLSFKGSGNHFQFTVANKNGGSSYLLDSTHQPNFATLASLVTAAYMAGKKIHVKATQNGDGPPYASEISMGAKAKEPKVKKQKPAKRVKGPVIAPQPAA